MALLRALRAGRCEVNVGAAQRSHRELHPVGATSGGHDTRTPSHGCDGVLVSRGGQSASYSGCLPAPVKTAGFIVPEDCW